MGSILFVQTNLTLPVIFGVCIYLMNLLFFCSEEDLSDLKANTYPRRRSHTFSSSKSDYLDGITVFFVVVRWEIQLLEKEYWLFFV